MLQLFSFSIIFLQGDFRSQKEAAWAVTNLTSGGSTQQLATIVQAGVLFYLCDLLNCKEWKTVIVVLDGLQNILAVISTNYTFSSFLAFIFIYFKNLVSIEKLKRLMNKVIDLCLI